MDAFDFIPATPAAWLRSGVLAPFVQAYWRYLTERQYASRTAKAYLCCVAHFARWSRRRRLVLSDLDQDLRLFVDEHLPRCNCPSPVRRNPGLVRSALRHLQVVLADAGVETDVRRADPIEAVLCRYGEYLRRARGLAQSTCFQRLKIVGTLVRQGRAATPSPDQLRRFIAQELARVSPASWGSVALHCAATCDSAHSKATESSICCR